MKKIFLLLFVVLSVSSYSQREIKGPVWSFHDDSTMIIGLSAGWNIGFSNEVNSVKVCGINFELLGAGVLVPLFPSTIISTDSSKLIVHRDSVSVLMEISGINLSPFGTVGNINVNGISVNGIASMVNLVNGISISSLLDNVEVMNGLQVSATNSAAILRGLQFAIFVNASYISMEGIQISLIGNQSIIARGLQVGIVNFSQDLKGVQIGVFNKTKKLKGLQIGLWNVNEKRKLPLLNW